MLLLLLLPSIRRCCSDTDNTGLLGGIIGGLGEALFPPATMIPFSTPGFAFRIKWSPRGGELSLVIFLFPFFSLLLLLLLLLLLPLLFLLASAAAVAVAVSIGS